MESDTQNNAPNDDDGEFNTSFGTELSEDFVTLIINTFCRKQSRGRRVNPDGRCRMNNRMN